MDNTPESDLPIELPESITREQAEQLVLCVVASALELIWLNMPGLDWYDRRILSIRLMRDLPSLSQYYDSLNQETTPKKQQL